MFLLSLVIGASIIHGQESVLDWNNAMDNSDSGY